MKTCWMFFGRRFHVRLLIVTLWPVIAITGPQLCLPTSTSLNDTLLPGLMNE